MPISGASGQANHDDDEARLVDPNKQRLRNTYVPVHVYGKKSEAAFCTCFLRCAMQAK